MNTPFLGSCWDHVDAIIPTSVLGNPFLTPPKALQVTGCKSRIIGSSERQTRNYKLEIDSALHGVYVGLSCCVGAMLIPCRVTWNFISTMLGLGLCRPPFGPKKWCSSEPLAKGSDEHPRLMQTIRVSTHPFGSQRPPWNPIAKPMLNHLK